jgi:Ner family transcriptional regulator
MPDMTSAGWHPQDIMAAVRKTGDTLRGLERRHGFGQNTFYKALEQRFPNAHSVIANAIGKTRHEIWPHFYDTSDRPLFRSRPDLLRRAA